MKKTLLLAAFMTIDLAALSNDLGFTVENTDIDRLKKITFANGRTVHISPVPMFAIYNGHKYAGTGSAAKVKGYLEMVEKLPSRQEAFIVVRPSTPVPDIGEAVK